jgi:hypothetical protein
MKKKIYFSILILCVILAYSLSKPQQKARDEGPSPGGQFFLRSIQSNVLKGETVFDIFKKRGLNMEQFSAMREDAGMYTVCRYSQRSVFRRFGREH